MSEFKGTPGPWDYDETLREVGDENEIVAELVVNGSEDSNGRLIAAAPELLEALQELVHADCHSVKNSTLQINALKKAMLAIHKALGQ